MYIRHWKAIERNQSGCLSKKQVLQLKEAIWDASDHGMTTCRWLIHCPSLLANDTAADSMCHLSTCPGHFNFNIFNGDSSSFLLQFSTLTFLIGKDLPLPTVEHHQGTVRHHFRRCRFVLCWPYFSAQCNLVDALLFHSSKSISRLSESLLPKCEICVGYTFGLIWRLHCRFHFDLHQHVQLLHTHLHFLFFFSPPKRVSLCSQQSSFTSSFYSSTLPKSFHSQPVFLWKKVTVSTLRWFFNLVLHFHQTELYFLTVNLTLCCIRAGVSFTCCAPVRASVVNISYR